MSLPISTTHLTFRRLVPSDAEAILAYRGDPEVSRYQFWKPTDVEEVRKYISSLRRVAMIRAGRWFQLGITKRDTGTLIGDFGLCGKEDNARQVELGITLTPSYQGRGLAREAMLGLIAYLFKKTDTHRIYCSVDPRNLRSVNLLKRIGMRQEAHMIQSIWHKGEWVDDIIFALLHSEYQDAAGRQPDTLKT